MLSSTFTLFAITILGIICTSQSFPKMDFSHVITRQRVKTKNTEVADLAKKLELLEKRLNETTQEMLRTNKDKVDLIETHINGVERKLVESQKEMKESKVEMEESKVEMEESKIEMKESKVEMEDVKNRVTRFQGKLTDVQGEAETVKNQIQNLETKMTVFQVKLNSITSTGTVKTTPLEELHTRVDAVEDKVDKLKIKMENTNEETRCLQHAGFFYDTSTKLCMRLFTSRLASPHAERACQKYGSDGRLVIPDTQRKHSALVAYMRSLGFRSSVSVNGKRDSSNTFRWGDHRPMLGVQWCPGEPRNSKCMSLWGEQGFCFDDSRCGSPIPYVCEIPMD